MPNSREIFNSEATRHKAFIPILICLALMILTVTIFWQLKDCGFINLDDPLYVYENAQVQSGLNWNSMGQAFSSELVEKSSNWHPLTWLSLMLDYSIFGLNPAGFHLINLLFHIINALLLFLIFHRMTKSLWTSAFVACLFAIHPLHVESVAWISERKDVLSTFFWMLTMGAYIYYVEHPGVRRYLFVLLLFILGLMAKPMLVTLPFVLLLLDFWPLQRFQEIKPVHGSQTEALKSVTSDKRKKKTKKKLSIEETLNVKKPVDPEYKWSLILPLIWEKIPFFVLTVLSSIVTYIAQQNTGTVASVEAISPVVRIGNAFVSYVTYLAKMIWPINLAVFYPHPGVLVPWQVFVSVSLLIAVTVAVFRMLKKTPYLASGWLWYLGTLVPVIGIVQVGPQAMADRYTYIPLIGLFIMVAWGLPDLLKKWNHRKEILLALSALSILCLSILTWIQVGYWQNSITLFSHTLKVTDNNWFIFYNRAEAYDSLGNYRQAIEDYSGTLKIKPDFAEAYNNRGIAHNNLGNHKQAFEDYARAIEIKPGYADAYHNRGNAYGNLGNYKQAILDLDRAIKINLNSPVPSVYLSRGLAHTGLGNYRQAIEDFNRAIQIKPGHPDPEIYFSRGNAHGNLGNYKQAIEDYNTAIEIKPDYPEAYFNRSVAYIRSGNKNLAVNDLKTAARLGDERAKNLLKQQGINQ